MIGLITILIGIAGGLAGGLLILTALIWIGLLIWFA
jgi:hypothetical protein